MTKKVSNPKAVEETEEKERNAMYKAARKVLLASIGVVALAQDEAEEFINKLVDRGEIAEKDARKLIRETMDKRKRQAKRAEGEIDKHVEDLLARTNVPSKADIQALSDKIAALAHKVDELKKTA